ncbi:MAG: multidrug ABC transporter ATP-binding protein [Bacteroidetes bacterium 46-16]|nr:MAG: multidrug ABC transporter ATP-binding protein [Bacteroidetes bacterium 46-16]
MARHRNSNITQDLPKSRLNREGIKEALALFRYVKPYRAQFFGALVLIGLLSAASLSFPYMFKLLIDSARGDSPLSIPASYIMAAMFCILIFQVLVAFFRSYLFTLVGEKSIADIRKDIYKHMIQMPMEFFTQRRVGELSNRVSVDVAQIQDTIISIIPQIIRGILTFVICICLILFISPKLTLLMLCMIPLTTVIAVVFGRRVKALSRKAQDQLAESGIVVQESLQGITNVKAFSNEWYELRRFTRSISESVRLALKSGIQQALFSSLLLFSLFSTVILIVWYSSRLMLHGDLTYGDLTAFIIYTAFLGGTLANFADLYNQLQKSIGATQRVRELLRESTENVHIVNEQLKQEYKLSGKVSFRNISFSYPGRKDVAVLKDINIEAAHGQQVAIVGPSGAGKSTITSLILRFYEPDSGQLLFDDKPGAAIPLSQLRMQMALVPQDVHLFGGTIYENIIYGKPDATEAEVIEAAKKANAHEFISRFPEAYQTVVGERGIKLSGGQRQRIAIARAILKDPVILILDEATSSLDSESEALVQEALGNLMKNRTSFVIAHRLSTIRNADQIIVLDEGRVVESGTHEELVRIEEGLYKNMSRMQLSE